MRHLKMYFFTIAWNVLNHAILIYCDKTLHCVVIKYVYYNVHVYMVWRKDSSC